MRKFYVYYLHIMYSKNRAKVYIKNKKSEKNLTFFKKIINFQ